MKKNASSIKRLLQREQKRIKYFFISFDINVSTIHSKLQIRYTKTYYLRLSGFNYDFQFYIFVNNSLRT